MALGILKAGSGLKPLLQKERCRFVGAAFAATLAPPKAQGSGLQGAAFIRGLGDLEGRRFGAKAPPTKSDPRVIENQGFEVKASPAKDR